MKVFCLPGLFSVIVPQTTAFRKVSLSFPAATFFHIDTNGITNLSRRSSTYALQVLLQAILRFQKQNLTSL